MFNICIAVFSSVCVKYVGFLLCDQLNLLRVLQKTSKKQCPITSFMSKVYNLLTFPYNSLPTGYLFFLRIHMLKITFTRDLRLQFLFYFFLQSSMSKVKCCFKHKIKCYEQISKSMFYLYEKGMPWRSYIYTETELKFGQWNEEKKSFIIFCHFFF